jgi:K+-transporting ATPase KdpF subunit
MKRAAASSRYATMRSIHHDGYRVRRPARRILRGIVGAGALLCQPPARRQPAMNGVYWFSGIAALAVFIYLAIALFKPEKFE